MRVRELLPAAVDEDAHAACLSLAHHIGTGAFAGSTALRKLKAGDRQGAATSPPALEQGRRQGAQGPPAATAG
ncbi:glycoside hydrolase family protein [Roseomonas marmotae]|uniref:glycoside hydrolase family protein n=1 Tax=Roseomonas marmotae TaxID=2768161 RepID=UPI0038D1D409